MRRAALAALLCGLATPALAGPFDTTDRAAALRGYQVYSEVCSACHSLKAVRFADLGDLGLDPSQVRALAAMRKVADGMDTRGRPVRRPGRPSDALPSPPVPATGAVPPDLSRMALTLEGGPTRIAAILTGYRDPPPGQAVEPGSYVDPAAPGGQLAMPPPLSDDAVSYADGTHATTAQMAHDVSVFLDWTAHPHRDSRRRIGVGVVVYLALLTGLAFFLKRRIWSDVQSKR